MAGPNARATWAGSLAGEGVDTVMGGFGDGAAPAKRKAQKVADQAASAQIATVNIRGNHVTAMPDYDSAMAGAWRPASNRDTP